MTSYTRTIIVMISVISLSACWYLNRPLIKDIKIESIASNNGTWIVLYRYSIDGLEQAVFLANDVQLIEYKAYLKKIGRF